MINARILLPARRELIPVVHHKDTSPNDFFRVTLSSAHLGCRHCHELCAITAQFIFSRAACPGDVCLIAGGRDSVNARFHFWRNFQRQTVRLTTKITRAIMSETSVCEFLITIRTGNRVDALAVLSARIFKVSPADGIFRYVGVGEI